VKNNRAALEPGRGQIIITDFADVLALHKTDDDGGIVSRDHFEQFRRCGRCR